MANIWVASGQIWKCVCDMMKRCAFLIRIILVPILFGFWGAALVEVRAAKLTVLNGGFEAGKQYWRGDGKVVTLRDGNKVGEMESDDRRLEHLAIGIDMGDLDVIEVR